MVEIVPIKPLVNEDAKMMAERLLADVLSGEISVVAICTVNRDGSIATCWSDGGDYYRLVGSLDVLKYRMIAKTFGAEVFQSDEN